MTRDTSRKEHKRLKLSLLVLLFIFSAVSIIFSIVVLFTDFVPKKQYSPAQSHGIFTTFIEKYIDEIHPQKLPAGRHWEIKNLEFPNKNVARVEAISGTIRSKLEFIYVIETPNVRVLKINDVTNRDLEDANLALIRFLNFLKDQDYTNAATLYGGSISRLVPYGPESAPLPVLLEGYCRRVSPIGHCLPFAVKDKIRDAATGTYRFTINYRLPDNTALKFATSNKESFTQIVESKGEDIYVVTTLPFD